MDLAGVEAESALSQRVTFDLADRPVNGPVWVKDVVNSHFAGTTLGCWVFTGRVKTRLDHRTQTQTKQSPTGGVEVVMRSCFKKPGPCVSDGLRLRALIPSLLEVFL